MPCSCCLTFTEKLNKVKILEFMRGEVAEEGREREKRREGDTEKEKDG